MRSDGREGTGSNGASEGAKNPGLMNIAHTWAMSIAAATKVTINRFRTIKVRNAISAHQSARDTIAVIKNETTE